MTSTLTRMKFPADTALTDVRVQLAKDAQEQLGYGKLAQVIAAPAGLLFGLRELGIEPLTTTSVKEYMAKKVGRPSMRSGRKAGFIGLAIVIPVMTLVFPWLVKLANIPAYGGWGAAGCLGVGMGSLFGTIGSFMGICHNEGTRTTKRWQTTSLSNYKGDVPEFVLDRALRIHAAVPQATFTVCQLEHQTDTYIRPDPDPFLVVSLLHEQYYVDVWDEKAYERTL